MAKWKEKLSKGKEAGAYTYSFAGDTIITNEKERKSISAAILNNAKEDPPPIKAGTNAYSEDIEKALAIKSYRQVETISFPLYEKQQKLLYLQVKAQGEKQHDKEFLKQDGEYFEIGKKCPRCSDKITLTQIEDLFGVLSSHKAFRQEIVDNLNKYIFESGKEIHINTCLRKGTSLLK